jgi:hypothetical protein
VAGWSHTARARLPTHSPATHLSTLRRTSPITQHSDGASDRWQSSSNLNYNSVLICGGGSGNSHRLPCEVRRGEGSGASASSSSFHWVRSRPGRSLAAVTGGSSARRVGRIPRVCSWGFGRSRLLALPPRREAHEGRQHQSSPQVVVHIVGLPHANTRISASLPRTQTFLAAMLRDGDSPMLHGLSGGGTPR